jgi:integrase
MRIPKPWKRAANQCWYVTLDGTQHNLGQDETGAKELYAQLLAKPRAKVGPEENVRKLLDLYWDWCKANLAESTCETRTRHLKSFWKFVEPGLMTSKLKPLHVQQWLDIRYPNAGPTYRNNLITTIKGVLSWAKSLGYIEIDPIAAMKKPRCEVRQEFIPILDWPKVFAAVKDRRGKDFLVVMLNSGIRVQEIRKAEARHLDGNRLVFWINEAKGKRRTRVIYLPDDALEIVNRLCGEFPEGPIFRTKNLAPWTKNSINCLMRRIKAKLGMKKLSATSLRHSFAHARLIAGKDSAVIATLLGHVDGRMLATRYGHLSANPEFLAAEANRLTIPKAPEPP